MPRIPIIKPDNLITALEKAGFQPIRQKGSHLRLKHPDGRVVTVPIHKSKDIGKGLLRKILRDVEWSVEILLAYLDK